MEAAPVEIVRVDAGPTKPGVRSTEFWGTLAVQVATWAAVVADVVPGTVGVIASVASQIGYVLARAFAKRPVVAKR